MVLRWCVGVVVWWCSGVVMCNWDVVVFLWCGVVVL